MIKNILVSLGMFALVLSPAGAMAADAPPPAAKHGALAGLDSVGAAADYNTNEADAGLTVIIAKFIKGLFGLLGIMMVILMVYAGFTWMTAGGDTTKVDKAKSLIRQSVIGFAIIMSAFAISSFVVSSLVSSTAVTTVEGGQP